MQRQRFRRLFDDPRRSLYLFALPAFIALDSHCHEHRSGQDNARGRLESITSDREAIEGFERMIMSDELDGAFLGAVGKLGISLDYILLGEGKPFFGGTTAPKRIWRTTVGAGSITKRQAKWGMSVRNAMVDLLKSLSDTSIPTILIVGGLLFLLLAIADKVHGELRVSEKNRKYALAAGLVLLVVGISIEVLVPALNEDASGEAINAQSGEWRTWGFDPAAEPSFNCLPYRERSKDRSEPQADVICMDKALADADRTLGDVYKAFRNSRPPDQIPTVKEEQREWRIQRNAACRANWEDLKTRATVEVIAYCMREQTERRTEYFRKALQQN